jgi:RHS repeat-associated protein
MENSGCIEGIGYTGKFTDELTGLQYNNARWYDPTTGRYLSEDPIQDGSNWYAYAKNNPILYVDPTGLSAQGHPLSGFSNGGYSGGLIQSENICKWQSKIRAPGGRKVERWLGAGIVTSPPAWAKYITPGISFGDAVGRP